MNADAPQRIVRVDSVDLKDAQADPELAQQLIEALQSREFDADLDWPAQISEATVRGMWQDRGYFKVVVATDYKVLSKNDSQARVSLALRVNPGFQYRLRHLEFVVDPQVRSPVFAPAIMRAQFPLEDGDIFNVSKIRQGLDALKRLYGSAGYIDMVTSPDFEFDDARQLIALKVEVQEGLQFVVEKIDFLGLTPETRRRLHMKLKPGYVYDQSALEDFLADNRVLLPEGASQANVSVNRNLRTATLSLLFDFRTCADFWLKSR